MHKIKLILTGKQANMQVKSSMNKISSDGNKYQCCDGNNIESCYQERNERGHGSYLIQSGQRMLLGKENTRAMKDIKGSLKKSANHKNLKSQQSPSNLNTFIFFHSTEITI